MSTKDMRVKLLVLVHRDEEEVPEDNTKNIEGMEYHRKPFKVELDSRPAMIKLKQDLLIDDPEKKGAKKQFTIEGYFRRHDVDVYIQMDATQTKRVLGYMIEHEIHPKDLTLMQLDKALVSQLTEAQDESEKLIVIPGEQDKTKGGIVIP